MTLRFWNHDLLDLPWHLRPSFAAPLLESLYRPYSTFTHLTVPTIAPPGRTTATKMSTIQNLKNFIRHGKQARHGDPTTNVSPVNAHQQRYAAPPAQHHAGHSDPNVYDHKPLQHAANPAGDFSVAGGVDNRNVAAQAGGAAAKVAGDKQKKETYTGSTERSKDMDPSVIERIVAEERESKGKLPRYPGLERWTLLEKMGDGAFSNVYRARDNTGQYGEAAIKVVRKFEMSSSQVSTGFCFLCSFQYCAAASLVFEILHDTPRSFLPTAFFISALCQHWVRLGRRPFTSGLQEAAQSCRGARHSTIISLISVQWFI